MAEDGFKVSLNVYDLSQGPAGQLSTTFLGKAIEAIWHTGVVVYSNEYYFGGGIQTAPVRTNPYGTPIRVVDLGTTHVPKDVFEMYLQEIAPRYTAETYSLLTHNCNNFSNEVAQFLVGVIQQLESTLRAGAVPQALQFRPSAASVNSNQTADGAVKPASDSTQAKDEHVDRESGTGSTSEGDSEKKSDADKDPLGDARGKVQEEITREFSAVRFWLDDWLGYSIADKINMPTTSHGLFGQLISDYYIQGTWHLTEDFILSYPDIARDIVSYSFSPDTRDHRI